MLALFNEIDILPLRAPKKFASLACNECKRYYTQYKRGSTCRFLPDKGLYCLACLEHNNLFTDSIPVYTLEAIMNTILAHSESFEEFVANPLLHRKDVERHLECLICHEPFSLDAVGSSPHDLGCGHTLCFSCCQKLAELPIPEDTSCGETRERNIENQAEDHISTFLTQRLASRKSPFFRKDLAFDNLRARRTPEKRSSLKPVACPTCGKVSKFHIESQKNTSYLAQFIKEFNDLIAEAYMMACQCGAQFPIDELLHCVTCESNQQNQIEPPALCLKCFVYEHNGHAFEKAVKQKILSKNRAMAQSLAVQLRTYETMIPGINKTAADLLGSLSKASDDFEERMKSNDSYDVAFQKMAECESVIKKYESVCEKVIPHLRTFEKDLMEVLESVAKLKELPKE